MDILWWRSSHCCYCFNHLYCLFAVLVVLWEWALCTATGTFISLLEEHLLPSTVLGVQVYTPELWCELHLQFWWKTEYTHTPRMVKNWCDNIIIFIMAYNHKYFNNLVYLHRYFLLCSWFSASNHPHTFWYKLLNFWNQPFNPLLKPCQRQKPSCLRFLWFANSK